MSENNIMRDQVHIGKSKIKLVTSEQKIEFLKRLKGGQVNKYELMPLATAVQFFERLSSDEYKHLGSGEIYTEEEYKKRIPAMEDGTTPSRLIITNIIFEDFSADRKY